jgi:integrase/recombinase XerD
MNSSLIIAQTPILDFEIFRSDNIQIYSFLNQPSISKGSKENYERILREFFSFYSGTDIKSVTTAHITLYLKKLEIATSTKNLHLRVIGAFFRFLKNTSYIEQNPAAQLKQERVPETFQFKILQREQIDRMIELENDLQKKILLKILYFTGLRISEAISLKTNSFRIDELGKGVYMTIVGKGAKVRTIYLPDEFFNEVSKYMSGNSSDDGYLFFDFESKKPLTRFQAFRIIKAAAKRAKVEPVPSPHWFRHTNATHSIEAGAPLHTVQATLGHSSITTTGKYLHSAKTESNVSYLLSSNANSLKR